MKSGGKTYARVVKENEEGLRLGDSPVLKITTKEKEMEKNLKWLQTSSVRHLKKGITLTVSQARSSKNRR